MTKSKKRRIKISGLLVVFLSLYLIFNILYMIWTMPIKSVVVSGNTYLKDNYIINYLDLDDTSILRTSRGKIINKLKKLDLVSDAKVKKNYFGTLYISIIEEKVLFYNWNTKRLVLSGGKETEYKKEYLGIPNLINYVKDDVYNELIEKMGNVNTNVISLISEIEYSPSIINDKIVDDKRFVFRINDGNIIYINTLNMQRINSYLEAYEVITNKNGNIKGCLYLDSNSDNKYFNVCDEVKERSVVNE